MGISLHHLPVAVISFCFYLCVVNIAKPGISSKSDDPIKAGTCQLVTRSQAQLPATEHQQASPAKQSTQHKPTTNGIAPPPADEGTSQATVAVTELMTKAAQPTETAANKRKPSKWQQIPKKILTLFIKVRKEF